MLTSISFVIGFIAAYWVYNDARGRGHELGTAILWSLGTLAMIIIFLPLYLLFGRRPRMTGAGSPPRAQDATIDVEGTPVEDIIQCPMCASKVKEEFKVCPYCAYTLKPLCQSCSRELNREWKTCPYCQTPTPTK